MDEENTQVMSYGPSCRDVAKMNKMLEFFIKANETLYMKLIAILEVRYRKNMSAILTWTYLAIGETPIESFMFFVIASLRPYCTVRMALSLPQSRPVRSDDA